MPFRTFAINWAAPSDNVGSAGWSLDSHAYCVVNVDSALQTPLQMNLVCVGTGAADLLR